MNGDLARILSIAYAKKMKGESSESWLIQELDSAALRQEATTEIAQMEKVISRRGTAACHLTSVYHDLLKAALKE